MTGLIDETRIALGSLGDAATGLVHPTIRLGVTGLSRAGKTVFITALVHDLLHGARLPLFAPMATGRIARAYLEPQPDDRLPRFAYEEHLAALTAGDERHWPQSTRRLSQLRLTVEYEPAGFFARHTHGGRLHIDIVDYPGEWLLDLPLMSLTYEEWSAATLAASRKDPRKRFAADWHAHLAAVDAAAPADEAVAAEAAKLFTAYLARCRADDVSLSSLPPGRFLMPGDLEGSPLLTFAPLDLEAKPAAARGSLHALMRRRYDSYVAHVVRPFFFDHFARLDRQIVLVDVLTALNAGAAALSDLSAALTGVLECFRVGARSWASQLFGRRIDAIVFAASKADLLHQSSHDRLEAILEALLADAAKQAQFSGARIDAVAMAAIRATREAVIRQGGEDLACIAGVPEKGERIGKETFDGTSEAAIFPGDLPEDPGPALAGELEGHLKFVRFRPPPVNDDLSRPRGFPHIRLDRALEFLIGDAFG